MFKNIRKFITVLFIKWTNFIKLWNKENNNLKIDKISIGCNFNDSDTINMDFKNYYLPKILCFVTTQNFFEEEEELLK